MPTALFSAKSDWWKKEFEHLYLDAYRKRLDASAKKEATSVSHFLKLKKGQAVLDVACGYGRHAVILARLGYDVTGVDFSKTQLMLAKQLAGKSKRAPVFVQGDMCNLHLSRVFDAAYCLFTSFGFFSDKDQERALRSIRTHLKPGGEFLLDLPNPSRVLPLHGMTQVVESGTVSHRIDLKKKRWIMRLQQGRRQFVSSVRLYSLPELRTLMSHNGFRFVRAFGDFEGSRYGQKKKRLIVVAKAI
ncbi:MAG: class I SAM-dependent methyltransferase [Patescibacteria group bacterium]|jgi:SAM-dependent methyltransferase